MHNAKCNIINQNYQYAISNGGTPPCAQSFTVSRSEIDDVVGEVKLPA